MFTANAKPIDPRCFPERFSHSTAGANRAPKNPQEIPKPNIAHVLNHLRFCKKTLKIIDKKTGTTNHIVSVEISMRYLLLITPETYELESDRLERERKERAVMFHLHSLVIFQSLIPCRHQERILTVRKLVDLHRTQVVEPNLLHNLLTNLALLYSVSSKCRDFYRLGLYIHRQ